MEEYECDCDKYNCGVGRIYDNGIIRTYKSIGDHKELVCKYCHQKYCICKEDTSSEDTSSEDTSSD
jgi:hypothetical protein